MTTGEIVITAFLCFVSAGFGTVLWPRLNRIKERLDSTAMKDDVNALRQETNALRHEVWQELRDIRSEVAGIRSDLTQIALAVGARPPRASQG